MVEGGVAHAHAEVVHIQDVYQLYSIAVELSDLDYLSVVVGIRGLEAVVLVWRGLVVIVDAPLFDLDLERIYLLDVPF